MTLKVDLLSEADLFLGDGINWASGDKKQRIITNLDEEYPDGENYRRVKRSTFLVEKWSDITSSQTEESRAALGYGLFSGGASFARSLTKTTSQYSVRVCVLTDVFLTTSALKSPQSPAYTGDAATFLATHGTHFVSARQRGGTLIALLSIETSSQTERESISKALNASGAIGSFSGSAAASITSKFEQIIGDRATSLSFEHSGGAFNVDSNDWKTFLSASDSFADTVDQAHSYNRRIWLEGYEVAEGIGGVFAIGVRKLALEQQYRLDDLGRLMTKLSEYKAAIDYVVANKNSFSNEDVQTAGGRKEEIAECLIALKKEADKVHIDASYVPEVPSTSPFAPPVERNVVVPEIEPPPSQPRVFLYTGPSKTGTKYEFTAPGGDFPPGLNDHVRSIEITGNFSINSWWITLCANGGGNVDLQTFVAPCQVNVIADGQTYEVLDIEKGKDVQIPIDPKLSFSSSIKISPNANTASLPYTFRPWIFKMPIIIPGGNMY